MRLIDGDALVERIVSLVCVPCREQNNDYKGVKCRACQYGDEIDDIESAPTIEQKTGRWIGQTPFVDTEECSCCGYNIVSNEMETPYCPNCGADMRIIETGEQNG